MIYLACHLNIVKHYVQKKKKHCKTLGKFTKQFECM